MADEEAEVEDSSSVLEIGSSVGTGSDKVSFVSAVESAPRSRKEKKKQRTLLHRSAKGDDFVELPPE